MRPRLFRKSCAPLSPALPFEIVNLRVRKPFERGAHYAGDRGGGVMRGVDGADRLCAAGCGVIAQIRDGPQTKKGPLDATRSFVWRAQQDLNPRPLLRSQNVEDGTRYRKEALIFSSIPAPTFTQSNQRSTKPHRLQPGIT